MRGADHSPQALALTLVTVALGLRTRLNPLRLVALGAALGVTNIRFCRTLGENGRIGTVSPRKQA